MGLLLLGGLCCVVGHQHPITLKFDFWLPCPFYSKPNKVCMLGFLQVLLHNLNETINSVQVISFPDVVGVFFSSIIVSICTEDKQEKRFFSTLIIIYSSWEVSYFKDPDHLCISLSGISGSGQLLMASATIFLHKTCEHSSERNNFASLTVIWASVAEYKMYPLIVLYWI